MREVKQINKYINYGYYSQHVLNLNIGEVSFATLYATKVFFVTRYKNTGCEQETVNEKPAAVFLSVYCICDLGSVSNAILQTRSRAPFLALMPVARRVSAESRAGTVRDLCQKGRLACLRVAGAIASPAL